jgi:hypothetical protein
VDLSTVHGDTPSFTSSQNWRRTPASLASNNEMTAADWWFAGLDQRAFMVSDVRWTMQVAGVHMEGSRTWIQIEFAEDPDSSLLLHLTPWAGLQDAINIVRAEIMCRTSSGVAGVESPGCLGDCHDVMIRGVASAAPACCAG